MCPTKDHGVRYSGSKDHGVRFRGSFCMRLSQDMGTGTVVCVFKIKVPVPVVFLNTDSSGTGTIEQNHVGSSSLNTIYGILHRSPRSLLCTAYPSFIAYSSLAVRLLSHYFLLVVPSFVFLILKFSVLVLETRLYTLIHGFIVRFIIANLDK